MTTTAVGERCPWKIRWTFGQDAACEKAAHGRDTAHSATAPNGVTTIRWYAGDRREFTGEWPGPCLRTQGCVLHTGHRGRCGL